MDVALLAKVIRVFVERDSRCPHSLHMASVYIGPRETMLRANACALARLTHRARRRLQNFDVPLLLIYAPAPRCASRGHFVGFFLSLVGVEER